jgi:hypothetical protein
MPDYDEIHEASEWMQRIATALKERLGIDLGHLPACEDDPERFAHIVEVAVQNAPKPKPKKRAVAMSQTRRNRLNERIRADRTVAWFNHIVGGEDETANAFNKLVGND